MNDITTSDFEPIETKHGDISGGLLLICDHASNTMPAHYLDLGVPKAELERHIGYDIGVRPLTLALAERFSAPAVLTTYSRLLIDPNRGEDDPTLIMRLSDGAIVPGNARSGVDERERRLNLYYRPYHDRITTILDQMIAVSEPPVVVSIHSYTPVWRGMPRPWHAGILWDKDPRAARPLIDGLNADPMLVVGDNEPYDGALKNDTMYKHGTSRGLAHALIEVRQDLIADDAGVAEWADRLAPILETIVADPAVRRQVRYGSRADDR